MKFYNPFCSHIVKLDNGNYAVRKFSIVGWKYFDNQKTFPDDYWWYSLELVKWFQVDTLKEAQELLELAKT